MIRLVQALIFFLSFSIEIEVNAGWEPLLNQSELVQYPANCEILCGYKTFPYRKYTVEVENKRMTLGSDTIVLKTSFDAYAFVSGEILLDGNFKIELPVGVLTSEGEKSLVYVTKKNDSFLIRTLFGNVKVLAKGTKKEIEIPQGYENTISGMSKRGIAETGFPVSVDANDMIYKWAELYDWDKTHFAKDVVAFKEVHKAAVDEISRTYTEVSGRMIASHEDWLKREKIRKDKERAERAALQKLFERKVMGLE